MEVPEPQSPERSNEEVRRGGWIGPLLLAATPFLFFALFFFADRLFR